MRSRLRQHVLTMLLTLGLIAGGGMALAAAGSVSPRETAEACPTEAPPTATETPSAVADPATEDESGDVSGDEQGDDERSCDDEAVDESDDQGEDVSGDETTGDEAPPAEDGTDPEREAECTTAAGVDPTQPSAEDPADRATGLDNAIAHVLANCLKNPDAPGLPNALEHLVANAARKAAHDAEKAARVHGNSADAAGHSGEAHGNSANAPGHSGEHGNPHV
jgi:hypothetical protein